MPQLQVMVGSDRHYMEPCRVNDTQRPHEIDNDHFVGRVLVRILDAPGAREGKPGREYFRDRSCRFCIQIEGRFKQRHSGDDVLFGTDFDKLINFPRTPFNAGMRVAKYVDPATFYEFEPPSGRPYIMSPYIACMNTICAWPAPSRAHEAVVVLRPTHRPDDSPASGSGSTRPSSPLVSPEKGFNDPHHALTASDGPDEEAEGDIVPAEQLHRTGRDDAAAAAAKHEKKKGGWLSGFGADGRSSGPKEERVLKRYWRFVGFRDEPRVRALLDAHHAKLSEAHSQKQQQRQRSAAVQQQLQPGASTPERHLSVSSVSSSPDTSARNSTEVQHAPAPHTLSRLGTGLRREQGLSPNRSATPELQGGDDDDGRSSLPVSPHIGAKELATASPGDVDEVELAGKQAVPAISHKAAGASLGGLGGLGEPAANGPTPAAAAVPVPAPRAAVSTSTTTNDDPPRPRPDTATPAAREAAATEKPEMPKLERISTTIWQEMVKSAKSDGLRDGDFKLADALQRTHLSASASASPSSSSSSSSSALPSTSSKLDAALGPFRFVDPGTDMIEDNAFIFTTRSLPTPKRRKHFSSQQHREEFHYDPDVVYGASFFTDAMDLNTFSLALGPVKLNVGKYFKEMPVRYTLRLKGEEEKTMCTVSFQIV